eukprot:5358866-Pyramimonas_sp.AAC.1
MQMIERARFLPTAQLVGAVWGAFMHQLLAVWRGEHAAKYLYGTYFNDVPVSVLQRVYKRIGRDLGFLQACVVDHRCS